MGSTFIFYYTLFFLYNGYRVFPGGKERPGHDADPSPLLVPWSRNIRAIYLLPLLTVRPVQRLSACKRLHFTFSFTFTFTLYFTLSRCGGSIYIYIYIYIYIFEILKSLY